MLGGRMVQASGSNGGGGGGGGGVTVLVQRGAQSMGSSTSVSVSLDNAVDTSQSFILVSRAVGNTSSPNGFLVEAYFDTQGSSVSSFTLERYGTTSGLTVYWQVVQMSNIAVQHFNTISFGTSTTSQSNTLTTLGGTDKAFAFVSGRLNSSSSSATHEGLFRADISSTSNCDVLRGASGTAASATLQVVEFTDSTTVEHQTITASGTSTSTTLSNSIDTTSAFVVYTFSGSSGNLSIVPYCYLSDATTITTGRGASSGTATIEAYVVNMSGVSTEVDTGSNITSTTTPVSISNVTDTSSAFCVFQSSNSGTGTSWANQLSGASMISTTEVDIIKNNTSNTNPWALQTMQC